MKVIVADDNTLIRDTYLELLPAYGFDVVAAVDNGFDAVEEFRRRVGEVGLVLLDNNMPWMSGIDAAYFIHRLDPTTRIVLASGSPPEGRELERAGVEMCVRKPFTIETLVRSLERPEEARTGRRTSEA